MRKEREKWWNIPSVAAVKPAMKQMKVVFLKVEIAFRIGN